MRITMQPGACTTRYNNTGASFCESCFATFMMHGCYPDRACILDVVDNGEDEVYLVIRRDGQDQIVEITDENRALLAFGERQGIQ
jgi:hypothetical protein